MSEHLRVVGNRRADRRRRIAAEGEHTVITSTDRVRNGPYSGADDVLRCVLGDAYARWPELVEYHRVEILHGMPELSELIGAPPETLVNSSPFEQRTRFYHARMIRPISHGIITFLLAYARKSVEAGGRPLSLVFEDIHAADPTMTEFVALLIRRADPALIRVIVSGTGTEPPAELADVLARRARTVRAPDTEPERDGPDGRDVDELVRAYVLADGTSDDPAELAAYRAADPAMVRALHDQRADELARTATPSVLAGPIPYHRERGSDPGGAGADALLAAMRHCVATGFSAAIADFGRRGRAVTDPITRSAEFCQFTNELIYASVDLGRVDEAFELCTELRKRYVTPKVHMNTSYTIAMIYTRFANPRDHELAVAWQNTAICLAHTFPEGKERSLFIGFQDNALALIEMHRGNLEHALELVESGMARLDREMEPDEWKMHRTQLLHNRARLRIALRRMPEALADYATLIEIDPYYTEYLTDRARIRRKLGDLDAAIADYERAMELAPPFAELYYNRGTARVARGDVEGALADFDYALEMEPEDVDTRISRAELYLARGDHAAAEADVRAGLEFRPSDSRLLCMLGTIEVEKGEPAAAIEDLDSALTLEPDYPAALVNRAVARFRTGDPASAAEDLTSVLALVGDDPDVLLNRGQAYLAEGRRELALADFDRALTLLDALHEQRARCVAVEATV